MSTPAAPFVPPFCPNELCAFHEDTDEPWHWVRAGFYTRQTKPQRIQRFRCEHCGRYFSEQTFRASYWHRRPELLAETFHALTHCTGYRQLARKLACSPQTLMRQADHLGRHCQLFHESLRPKGEVSESLGLDGFRAFEYSQYHPSEYHLVIGRQSHYTYGFTHSELRRSGSMTARQRRRRAELERELGRPDPRSVEREVARVLGIVAAGSRRIELHTDENPAYPRALGLLPWLEVEHHTISSRAARTPRNTLFAINLFDGLVRHSCANHKRETIAFSKRSSGGIARMWVMLAWRNHVKWFSERRRGGTPAMRAGVCERRLSVREILEWRLFPRRIGLPEAWADHYWGRVPARQYPRARPHRLKYAA
jgi:transposase-like protein